MCCQERTSRQPSAGRSNTCRHEFGSGKAAPEIAATANISAFNLANALGGMIGGAMVDSAFGPGGIPYAAPILPLAALLFILSKEGRSSAGPVLSPWIVENH
jgi:predicted MFS family arabinose efflux permease